MFNWFETECPRELFGHKCEGKCSKHCINNQTCNHVTGICPAGCIDGYRGDNCNQSKHPCHTSSQYVCGFFY